MFEKIKSPYRIDKKGFKMFLASRGMSQSDFASILGIFPNQVSIAVNGKAPLTNRFVLKFKQAMQNAGANIEEVRTVLIEK